MTPTVLVQRGAIARIRFNRPSMLNAADASLAQAFREACQAIAADEAVRVVVLSGEGRAFMAGGDVSEFQRSPHSVPASLIDPLHEGLQCLAGMRAPVVASLHGAVAGAGMSLALGCDLAIAADDTVFNFAYSRLGASCDLGGSWHLPRLVGLRRAMEIAWLNEPIHAERALQLGLVNRVVPAAALADETEALCQRLAGGARVAQGVIKGLLRQAFSVDLASQLAAERAGFAACAATDDFAEGVAAFLAKRPPAYRGR